jgi:hypothetical protein
MKRPSGTTIAVLVFAALVLALIVYSTLGLGGVSCEVCMEYQGMSRCRSAQGTTRQEATKTATENACAFLASGVTDSIACNNTPPRSVRCGSGE